MSGLCGFYCRLTNENTIIKVTLLCHGDTSPMCGPRYYNVHSSAWGRIPRKLAVVRHTPCRIIFLSSLFKVSYYLSWYSKWVMNCLMCNVDCLRRNWQENRRHPTRSHINRMRKFKTLTLSQVYVLVSRYHGYHFLLHRKYNMAYTSGRISSPVLNQGA